MKLNLGGAEGLSGGPGSPPLEGFLNVDIRQYPGIDIVADCRDLSWVTPGSVDVIRASHIIEHFTPQEARAALTSWHRALKPRGTLLVFCPDARTLARDLIDHVINADRFSRFLFGNQSHAYDLHRWCYDVHSLTSLVESCHFTIIEVAPRPNAYPYDLGIEAEAVVV